MMASFNGVRALLVEVNEEVVNDVRAFSAATRLAPPPPACAPSAIPPRLMPLSKMLAFLPADFVPLGHALGENPPLAPLGERIWNEDPLLLLANLSALLPKNSVTLGPALAEGPLLEPLAEGTWNEDPLLPQVL